MIIAVAAEGREVSDAVDQRFGRAPYFVIHDTVTNAYETVENGTNVQAAHGAGTGAAQEITSRHVNVVVAGNMGPKAEAVLEASGVKMITWADGTVADAIELAKSQVQE